MRNIYRWKYSNDENAYWVMEITLHEIIRPGKPVKPYCYRLAHTIIIPHLRLQLTHAFSTLLCSSLLNTLTSRVRGWQDGHTAIHFSDTRKLPLIHDLPEGS